MKLSHNLKMKSFLKMAVWSFATSLLLPASGANYDEDKVPNYTLPELLKTSDGRIIKTSNDWAAIRRPEILELFRDQVFGKAPAAPESISFRVDHVYENSLNGLATQKEVTVFFSEDRQGPQMSLLLFIPNRGITPRPAFIGLNFNGNHTVHPSPNISITRSWVRNNSKLGITDNRAKETSRGTASSRWAIEKIIRRGYAVVTVYYGDIDPDYDDGFENGLHSQFHNSEKKPTADEWGSIAAWSWGLSRALDYLEMDSSIDHERVSVIGHSRLGKTSLWAGATDQRFALIISNNSGCGGAALSRREFGETVARINTSFPHWFCDNFVNYNSRVSSLPVDQHMLIALSAPRPIYVASATEDRWADPKGEFLAAKLASPAYNLFGLKALEESPQPSPDKSVGDRIAYHIRTGKHDVTDFDWEQYLNFADRHLK